MAVFWQNYKNPKAIAFANTRQYVTLVDTLGSGVDWNTATVEIYAWHGNRTTDKPASPTSTLVIPQGRGDIFGTGSPVNGVVQFEIADFVRPILDFETYSLTGTAIDYIGTGACWVSYDVTDDGTSTTYNSGLFLFVDGYGLYSDNTNAGLTAAQATLNPLWSLSTDPKGMTHALSQNADIWIPIYIGYDLTSAADTVRFVSVNGNIEENILFAGTYGTTGLGLTTGTSNVESSEQIALVPLLEVLSDFGSVIPADSSEVSVTNYNSSTGAVTGANAYKFNFDCTRAEGTVIYYQNRQGTINTFPILGRIDEEVNATRESVFNNTFNTDTLSYDVNAHMQRIYQSSAKTRYSVNTGLLNSLYNDMLIEMLLSKRHWVVRDGSLIPIVPTANTRELITSRFDRPTNIELTFDAANPYASTVL